MRMPALKGIMTRRRGGGTRGTEKLLKVIESESTEDQ